MKKSEQGLRDKWDNIEQSNIHTVQVPGGAERVLEELTADSVQV